MGGVVLLVTGAFAAQRVKHRRDLVGVELA
jgi:hypothetical protein